METAPLGDSRQVFFLKSVVHELKETLPKVSGSEKALHDFINQL